MAVCKKNISAILEPPTATQLERIRINTNETSEEKLLHNERLFHDWIRCQSHFPKNIDNGFVRAILRGSKHRLETAKRKLENHLAARHIYPELYSHRSPFNKEVIQAMDVVSIGAVPRQTEGGSKIYIFRLNRPDPSEFIFPNIAKLFFMMYEFSISTSPTYCGDITVVFDGAGFGTGHMVRLLGTFLPTLSTILKEAYAMRVRKIHVINAPAMMSKILAVVKPIAHPKVRESIFIHESPEVILDMYGPDLLPSDYGGNLKSLRDLATDWYDVVNDHCDWFEHQENVKITGIPKKVRNTLYRNQNFGIEGSFRKLEID